MPQTYTNPVYDYRRSPDQDTATAPHHPVIIVGAGPCGLAAALDLALQGVPSVILDDNDTVSVGSRAICFAKRTLEIMDRYGCAERMVDKGITWQSGKVFFQDDLIYAFNLLPESGHKLPAFINLQQYYFEQYLVERVAAFETIDLRWKNKVSAVDTDPGGTRIQVDTPEGSYPLTCDYLLVADGANSKIRTALGLESKGQVFQDRFLIADVVMKARFPTERWFWFDPPFHRNQSALLHRQADDVWRIDLQLGWDADPAEEIKEANIRPRLQAMLGEAVEFDLEWASVYTFQCRKMDNFIHRRVVFIGDAAHQVSPFGARGANGGIQAVENLAWKLARILRGSAPVALLQTYNDERQRGAAENILHSTRATDFITPKNRISRIFRDETLRLAKDCEFARALVNSGRLSTPCHYTDSPLNSIETGCDAFSSDSSSSHSSSSHSGNFHSSASNADAGCSAGVDLSAGAAPLDAPVTRNGKPDWLLDQLGNRFVAMVYLGATDGMALRGDLQALQAVDDLDVLLVSDARMPTALADLGNAVIDSDALVAERYHLQVGTTYLFRPDQIIAGRWRQLSQGIVTRAMRRALGFDLETAS
ncbi:FAD-dependent oxidoreductase [Exilibacterium tricleocarpae]|uniref:FAD-dependent oxidoreductase n=1 Tax=Exilibacterium tricleocarpae TaxID=2591008 RepID=A0A545TNV3_9GAMM|nr:FAD-dependent oxidoreductase [Exilibacterium tricleocarpae]TQV78851.1 FAD-dependent oxidoreductase [Exilibacterium tricleocarpae]